jgi:hypothetical protein
MKGVILSIITGGFLMVVLSGYSSGLYVYGLNRTGAGGSQPDCAGSGCHSGNTSEMDVNINLRELGGNYLPGNAKYTKETIYWVVLRGHTSAQIYPEFGFQFAALTTTNEQGAVLPTTGLYSNPVGGIIVTEQSAPIPKTGFSDYVDSFLWQSPKTGSLTLYATMLASNDDNFHTGDLGNNSTRSFLINSIESISEKTKIAVYPNPVSNQLNVSLKEADKGVYEISAYDLKGRAIYNGDVTVSGTEASTVINTSAWAAGAYVVKLKKDGAMRTIPLVKL